MRAIKLVFFLLLCAVPLSANTVCVAENYSSIVGTTCDIGSLTFTFDGTYSIAGGWTASDLYFIPGANGFTFDFDGGPQSVSANNPVPFGGTVVSELELHFNVTAPPGYYLNGVNLLTSANFGASGLSALAIPGAISAPGVGQVGNYEVCSIIQSPNCQMLSFYYGPTPPFPSTASFYDFVFGVEANNGTAHWDGSPETYVFSRDNNVPESSTLSLLATGLLGLMGMGLLRKRLVDSKSY
jgi:hypothetical protein